MVITLDKGADLLRAIGIEKDELTISDDILRIDQNTGSMTPFP
ncbi:hypothetical protein [Nitrobacter hamburgensis]|nr:hypothetical protein [Nitrobacter hamburgensis]